MYVEDPLSEELLRGTSKGRTSIRVVMKEVGDEKLLDFLSSVVEYSDDESLSLATVGAGEETADSNG